MSDLKNIADDITTKAALAAGKDAAERALEGLLTSDDEKAQKEAKRAAASKTRRFKLIAFGVVGLLLVVGLLGLFLSYWQWFLLAGVLGLGGLYGWYRVRKVLRARKKEAQPEALEAKAEHEAAELRVEEADEPAPRDREELAEEARRRAAELREQRAHDAQAREEAQAIEEQQIDDELAAMKARLKK